MLNVSVRDEHYALFAGSKDAFDKIAHYIYHVCWLKGDVEMRQSIWSPFEVALLIDTYWRIKNNHIAKREAVSEISALFRNYAIAQGRDIDDTYRNENGITLRLGELHYLFSDGKVGVKNTSSLFRIMVKMYQQNPQAYKDILATAKTKFNDSPVHINDENADADSSPNRVGDLLDQIYEDLEYGTLEEPEKEEKMVNSTKEDISNGIRLILDQHFPYGFKLDSVRDLMRFRRFADTDAINGIPEDDDELKELILSVGAIINDKVYAKSENLSKELQQIAQKIFADGTGMIYYDELLNHESEWMNRQHITSESMLKELLQKYFPDCHHAKRFMLNGGKQTEKESLIAELKRVWGDKSSRSVDDLSADLPFIPTDNIWRGPSQITWTHEYRFCEAMRDIAERMGCFASKS